VSKPWYNIEEGVEIIAELERELAEARKLLARVIADCDSPNRVKPHTVQPGTYAQLKAAMREQEAGEVGKMQCPACGGSGFITYNPNLNPNENPGTVSARCPYCNRKEAGEVGDVQ
jgi:hypothetical protein